MVGNQTLGNGLSDGVNLRNVTTSGDLDSDVDVLELVQASQRQWLVDLETQDLGLHQGDGSTVNFDQTLTGLNVGDGGGGLLLTKSLEVSTCSVRGFGRRFRDGSSLVVRSFATEVRSTYLNRWGGHLDLGNG